jgi:hypothetical protein
VPDIRDEAIRDLVRGPWAYRHPARVTRMIAQSRLRHRLESTAAPLGQVPAPESQQDRGRARARALRTDPGPRQLRDAQQSCRYPTREYQRDRPSSPGPAALPIGCYVQRIHCRKYRELLAPLDSVKPYQRPGSGARDFMRVACNRWFGVICAQRLGPLPRLACQKATTTTFSARTW